MENQFEIPNVRFVHVISQELGGQGRGLTIAYVRQEDYLAFAWADKRPGEPYVKAIGREVTVGRLKDWLQHPEFGTLTASQPVFISPNDTVGVMHVDALKTQVDILDIFTQNVVNQLTWFDVKHASISRFLKNLIAG